MLATACFFVILGYIGWTVRLADQRHFREAFAYMYQYAGATNAPVEVLDNLAALANGETPPHPWKYPAGPKE